MLAIFFYSVASLLLPVIIINAKDPVMDFSQLVPPTATTISTIFPPAPVPAAGVGHSSSSVPQDFVYVAPPPTSSKFGSFLIHILPTKNGRSIASSYSFLSFPSFRRAWRSKPKRSSSSSHKAATRRMAEKDGWEVEEKPYKSRYSPRAVSSASSEEYDAYGFRQNTNYNKSGSCSPKDQTDQQSQQQPQQPQDDHFSIHDDWRAPMQHIALSVKP
ncbi:hypothetical protein K457DRAFT_131879 [Linnemannia elongata AG-77]|uniref:Uncharacterized protein n=1 Tax=Linnemannia elongata AG-77 TaxID=1314771 RepID=A0A197KGM4_9FUNG|nr:hypothetical protein K457DRAFT_131879 [Linnemannia elongata AG-77]